ncbi:MAG: metal-sulfur cluster assembly factor [Spirochaetia bacterium]|nr:metal-sulfur cluster assembly factor [Spirochaetia bacterium]
MSVSNLTKEQVLEALSEVMDPELHINLVDLGLIYNVKIDPEKALVEVDMTFTSVGCPVGPSLLMTVQNRCMAIEGVKDAVVHIVFDPPWNPRVHATEDGKMELGIF